MHVKRQIGAAFRTTLHEGVLVVGLPFKMYGGAHRMQNFSSYELY